MIIILQHKEITSFGTNAILMDFRQYVFAAYSIVYKIMNNWSHTEWKHVSYSQHRKVTLIFFIVMCKLSYSFEEIRVVHVHEILPKLYLRYQNYNWLLMQC